jgi:hypothetical protein
MKTILIVTNSQVSTDVRVLRHIAALKDDYRIVTVGYGPRPPDVAEHLEIPPRLRFIPLNPSALVPHLIGLYRLSSRNTAAIRLVATAIRSVHFDLVLLNDAQTLPLVENLDTPVIADMHEYAPREMEKDWRFRFFLKRYYAWLCHRYLPRATTVTTVSPSLAREYSTEFRVEAELIYNSREYLSLKVRPTGGSPIRLIHTGLAARDRRLDVMIDAVAEMNGFSLDMFLVSAPRQGAVLQRLVRRARRTSNVRIMEPVPSDALPALINQYDVSLVYLSPISFSVRHSLPNKLFDSIQARVAVVVGPSPDMVEFCREHDFGLLVREFAAESLSNCLSTLDVQAVDILKRRSDEVASVVTAAREAEKLRSLVRRSLLV